VLVLPGLAWLPNQCKPGSAPGCTTQLRRPRWGLLAVRRQSWLKLANQLMDSAGSGRKKEAGWLVGPGTKKGYWSALALTCHVLDPSKVCVQCPGGNGYGRSEKYSCTIDIIILINAESMCCHKGLIMAATVNSINFSQSLVSILFSHTITE
jgi:hypothetical protein